jgi:hypothetical protein
MEVILKPNLIRNIIMYSLVALVAIGWTAFFVSIGTRPSCGKDTIVVECNTKPEITVECHCCPEPEPMITLVRAHISICEDGIVSVVIDIDFDDDTTERLVIELADGVEFVETYGDFTVEAMYEIDGYNMVSYANVTRDDS